MKIRNPSDPRIKKFSNLDRRQFLKTGIGLTFAIALPAELSQAEERMTGSVQPGKEAINAYVSILPNGKIKIIQPAAEMGQGVHTSLPIIVAEELDANWDDVIIEISPSFGEEYGDPVFLNMIFTSASRNVHNLFERLRIFGAQARHVLLINAAEKWQVPVSELRTEASRVMHDRSNRKLSYAEIASFGSLPEQMPEITTRDLKSPADFRLIGKSVPKRQIQEKISGQLAYSIDEYPDDVVFAAVARSPVEGAKLISFDDIAAKNMPGVIEILREGDEVAVVAQNYWQAQQAKNRLKLKWQAVGDVNRYNNAAALKQHMALVREPPDAGFPWDGAGDIAAGFGNANRIMDSEYQSDYAYHAGMEPLGAIVSVSPDDQSAEAWVGTQVPAYTIGVIARATGI